jgi:hypothetical protein
MDLRQALEQLEQQGYTVEYRPVAVRKRFYFRTTAILAPSTRAPETTASAPLSTIAIHDRAGSIVCFDETLAGRTLGELLPAGLR